MRILHRFLSTGLIVALLALAVGFGFMTAPRSAESAAPAAQSLDSVYSVPLIVSGARTATGVGTTVCGLGPFKKFAVQLLVTAHAGTTPTLDVTWQHSIDGGTTWFTVVAFTQVTTTDGNQLKVESDVESGTAEIWGDCQRVSYVIAGTTPSYTFSAAIQAQ